MGKCIGMVDPDPCESKLPTLFYFQAFKLGKILVPAIDRSLYLALECI